MPGPCAPRFRTGSASTASTRCGGPLDAALARLQIPLAPDTPDYRFLQRQAAWGLTTVANVNERREAGIYEDDAFFTIPPAPMPRMAETAAPTVPAAAPAPMARDRTGARSDRHGDRCGCGAAGDTAHDHRPGF